MCYAREPSTESIRVNQESTCAASIEAQKFKTYILFCRVESEIYSNVITQCPKLKNKIILYKSS